jgi:hypothetical protein
MKPDQKREGFDYVGIFTFVGVHFLAVSIGSGMLTGTLLRNEAVKTQYIVHELEVSGE